MSSIVQAFDPSVATTEKFVIPQSAVNGALVFWNESNISLNISLQTGEEFYLPAWYHKHKCGYSGSVNVAWAIRTVLSSNSPPVSELIVEAYDQGEAFPADGPLVRQTNTGNVVTTSQGNTLSIINDGNAAGTSIVESTVQGDSTSAVSITNDAQIVFGTNAHPTLAIFNGVLDVATVNANTLSVTPNTTSLLVTNITGALTVSGANVTVIGGTLQLDNGKGIFFKDTGGTYRQTLAASNTDKTLLASAGGNFEFRDVSGNLLYSFSYAGSTILINATSFIVQTSGGQARLSGSAANTHVEASGSVTLRIGGVDVLIANATGISLLQPLNLSGVGGFAAQSTFTGTNTTIGVAHNLGTTPDFIEISCTSAGSTATFGYSALTSTTCTITCGANVSWKAVAYKY